MHLLGNSVLQYMIAFVVVGLHLKKNVLFVILPASLGVVNADGRLEGAAHSLRIKSAEDRHFAFRYFVDHLFAHVVCFLARSHSRHARLVDSEHFESFRFFLPFKLVVTHTVSVFGFVFSLMFRDLGQVGEKWDDSLVVVIQDVRINVNVLMSALVSFRKLFWRITDDT